MAIASTGFAAGRGGDPFGTERFLAPKPGSPWQPFAPLPKVEEGVPRVLPLPQRPLSLPELTELALQNNPKSRQAWYAARAAAAAVGVERSDDLPELSASVLAQRGKSAGQAGNQIDWLTRYGPAVTLSYLLYDFGASESRARAAEYQALAAALAHNRALQEVVFQVEQAYYVYLGAEALVRANEVFLKSVQTSLEATLRRREAGLATVADVYRAETQVAQAQLNLTRSQGSREKARGLLAAAVGLPVDAKLQVQTIEAEPPLGEVTATLEELLARAKRNRPDLVAAEAQVRAARAQAEAVARGGLPTVTLNATGGRTFYHGDRAATETQILQLNVSIPLFTGFRHTYSVRQAEARALQAEATREALSRQTELDVWQAYYDVQTAAGGVRTTAVQLRAAQQTAEATLARYRAGFGSLLDLITAQVEEANARVQRIQSFLDWYTAVARLNFSIGLAEKTLFSPAGP